MRLRRLDLTRYGAFTGHTLDFGATRKGAPDLHIIYGANEAGKSTLRSAIGDLLFGMDRRTPYGFLHGYKAMEIGAQVELGGKALEWRRIKADKNDLLGADGSPAGAALIDAVLGGMTRKTFDLMFSLDSETLKEGGDELHRSHGRLSEALFSATSGLSSISVALERTREEAEDIFKPRGQKQRISELKRELAEIEAQRRAVEVSAPQYRKLVEAAEEACAAYRQAREEGEAGKKRLKQIERWQNAMNDWARLRLARERLEDLRGAPDIPDEAADRLTTLADAADQQTRDMERTRSDLERLQAECEKLRPDDAILEEAEDIDRLASLTDKFQEARDGLPGAEADLAAQRGRLDEAMARVGGPAGSAAEDLLLPAPFARQLDDLIREHERASAAVETAAEEAQTAREAVEDIKQSLEALGPSVEPAMLHQLRHDARAARSALDTTTLEDAVADARAGRDKAFAALDPWHGTAEALRAAAPPDESDIRRWADALGESREARDRFERQRAEKARSAEALRAAHAAIRAEAGLPDEAEVQAARAARDERWQAHRAAISDGALPRVATTAETFERAMLADDDIREKRARHSDDAARLRQLAADAAQAEATTGEAEKARDEAQARIDALQAEIDAVAAQLGLSEGISPDALKDWAEARERALAAQDDMERHEARLEAASANRQTLHARIAEALDAAGMAPGTGTSFGALVEMVEEFIRQAEATDARRTEMRAQSKREKSRLDQRERRAAQAREALEDWGQQWNDAIAACWLGADGAARTPAEVGEILSALERVREAHEQASELERSIARWTDARDSFLNLCRTLGDAAGVAMDETAPSKTVTALRQKLDEARHLQGKREQADQEIARLQEALGELEHANEATMAERSTLAARFGVPEDADLREMLGQARAKALAAREAGEIEDRLRTAFEGRALDAIERELAGCDADALAIEAERLSAEIAAQDERVQELYHAMKTAEGAVEAVGSGDAAAELAEQHRLLLLQLDEEAWRYLRLTAGIAAAEAALRLYRDRHRSGMMLSAAEALRHITAGRFADLQSRPDKDSETLVAIKAEGGSLTVDEMSDGTRDQLYLALRMAGYREFAATREPLPFIADDVMQTFDDDRTRAAFEMLGEIATHGQVIYLTHHAHLCEIAREALGKAVRVHELPGPGAAQPHPVRSARAG